MAATVYSKSDPIMAELRSLLVSKPVQKIHFQFGSFQLRSLVFRNLALELADPSSWMSVAVDSVALKNAGAAAEYDTGSSQWFGGINFRQARVGRYQAQLGCQGIEFWLPIDSVR